MISFLNNLGLLLLRLVTGALVSIFAARELAQRSDIIQQTLEFFEVGAADIVKVFAGCFIIILSVMLVLGLWTRIISLVLLILLAIGGYCWLPQDSQIYFHLEALYGIVFFFLLLVGGGQWSLTRRRGKKGQSVLESEHSILTGDKKPSIFEEEQGRESFLTPPREEEKQDQSQDEDERLPTDFEEDDRLPTDPEKDEKEEGDEKGGSKTLN